jgi:ubiquinone/menaquinone biosynthesis C-methylase UbiE
VNYFAYASAAERYAKSRPYFHPIVIEKIREFLTLESSLPKALDVACGTGQSTRALNTLAEKVIGVDLSEEMLAFAKQENAITNISYLQSSAEVLPFENETFDLITVSLAFHWFERSKFLAEANRVLKSNGWLVIYNNNFAAMMKENPEFEPFVKNIYATHYPQPTRNSEPITQESLQPFGLQLVSHEFYSNEVLFTVKSLVNYLMTHSNVIAKVEQGTQRVKEAHAWLTEKTKDLLPHGKGTFMFKGNITYLQKS